VIHLKPRVIFIICLLVLFLSAPAFAERVDYLDVTYGQDQNGNPRTLSVHFDKVVETDTSEIFSPMNYPLDKYKFITVYYYLSNPSDKDVFYELNISIRDQANRYFYTDEFIHGETVSAGKNTMERRKDFAVYRNSTNLQIVWTDKDPNPPWEHYDTFIPLKFVDVTPTPSATAVPAPTPTPTPSPTPSPAGGCLPFLPIGLLICSIGGLGLFARQYRGGR
jgi:hypothetical protein